MRVRKKFVFRVFSFLLAFVLAIVGFGVEAFAKCPSKPATMHTGWYTLAGANSSESTVYGKNWASANGHFASGVPTHALHFDGKWHPAFCLDPTRGAMCSDNFYKYGTHYCVAPVIATPAFRTILAAILYKGHENNAIPVNSSGNIGVCGGNPATDHYLVVHMLVWAVRSGKVTLGQDSLINITADVKEDLNWIVKQISSRHRPRDGVALRAWIDNLYKQLGYCFRVPSFATYTGTHPLGDKMNGKPGNGSNVITLTVTNRDKNVNGWYVKDFKDDNGVINGFDFDMEKHADLFAGAPGVYVKKINGGIQVQMNPKDCMTNVPYESKEIKRTLPFGEGSILWFDCLNNNEQRFAVYQPGTSLLGAKIRVVFVDVPFFEQSHGPEPSESFSTDSFTTTPGVITTNPPQTPPPTPSEVYIRKTSDDGNVAGIVFTITGNGEVYHKKTDENGFIDLSDLPQYVEGTQQLIEYHVEEEIPVEYIHDRENASKNFVLEPGKTVYLDFNNKQKVWRLTFKKHDSSLATQAQGKGTLAGAIFAVYKDGELLDTYTTDENGEITTEYYPCGPGYTLTELSPPAGYMSDPTVYAIGLMPGETLEQYNDCNRMEALDGDDPEVIRSVYSIKSALDYKATNEAYMSKLN